MACLSAAAKVDKAEKKAKFIRDKAYTHMKTLVDEVSSKFANMLKYTIYKICRNNFPP